MLPEWLGPPACAQPIGPPQNNTHTHHPIPHPPHTHTHCADLPAGEGGGAARAGQQAVPCAALLHGQGGRQGAQLWWGKGRAGVRLCTGRVGGGRCRRCNPHDPALSLPPTHLCACTHTCTHSQFIADMPLRVGQGLIFGVILYWIGGWRKRGRGVDSLGVDSLGRRRGQSGLPATRILPCPPPAPPPPCHSRPQPHSQGILHLLLHLDPGCGPRGLRGERRRACALLPPLKNKC